MRISAALSISLDYCTLNGGVAGNVEYYYNIPFAQPPIGELRFAPPKPPKNVGVLDNTKLGNACVQDMEGNEDCLNLNVYRPVGTPDTFKLPVIVFLYGGSFKSGSNSVPLYDGNYMLAGRNDSILVTVNYRVGAFGFLSGTELNKSGQTNAGLLDQKLAFEWVKNYINKFGGDPDNVTAMGQSAGAISVSLHMLTEYRLFEKAILLSGGPLLNLEPPNNRNFDIIVNATNCQQDSIKCLKSLSASVLNEASKSLSFGPTLGYTNQTRDVLNSGKFQKMPILMNLVSDEGTLFVQNIKTSKDSQTFVERSFQGYNANEIVNNYKISDFSSYYSQASTIFADAIFACSEFAIGNAYSEKGLPVSATLFDHVPKIFKLPGDNLGVFHAANLPFVFRFTPLLDIFEIQLADRILEDIISFAKGKSNLPDFKSEKLACPWAHRTLIMRKLKGLENEIGVSVVDYIMGSDGWSFSGRSGSSGCPLGSKYIKDLYYKADPEYNARFTVPLLWDLKTNRIVNNESSDIIRMMNDWNNKGNYYPAHLKKEIDDVNDWVYHDINNGVYKCGFATTQDAYDKSSKPLFAALDKVEAILATKKWLCDEFTEADIRLFTTIVRFDVVYHTHFKCNLKTIEHGYPNILKWGRRFYQIHGIKETVDMEHIKGHYYLSHRQINPYGIVPICEGPDWSIPIND